MEAVWGNRGLAEYGVGDPHKSGRRGGGPAGASGLGAIVDAKGRPDSPPNKKNVIDLGRRKSRGEALIDLFHFGDAAAEAEVFGDVSGAGGAHLQA